MAKQKSNKTGQGYMPHLSAKQIHAALEGNLMQVARKMRVSHDVAQEYVHNENCPGCQCKIELVPTAVGKMTLSVSGWYCEEQKLAVYYVLCESCSSQLPNEGLYELIQANTLAAWHSISNGRLENGGNHEANDMVRTYA